MDCVVQTYPSFPPRRIRIRFDVGIKGQSGAKEGHVDVKGIVWAVVRCGCGSKFRRRRPAETAVASWLWWVGNPCCGRSRPWRRMCPQSHHFHFVAAKAAAAKAAVVESLDRGHRRQCQQHKATDAREQDWRGPSRCRNKISFAHHGCLLASWKERCGLWLVYVCMCVCLSVTLLARLLHNPICLLPSNSSRVESSRIECPVVMRLRFDQRIS
jgi:hypothetical protein